MAEIAEGTTRLESDLVLLQTFHEAAVAEADAMDADPEASDIRKQSFRSRVSNLAGTISKHEAFLATPRGDALRDIVQAAEQIKELHARELNAIKETKYMEENFALRGQVATVLSYLDQVMPMDWVHDDL